MKEGKPIETVGVGAGGRDGDPSQAGEDGNEAGKMSSAWQGLRWPWAEGVGVDATTATSPRPALVLRSLPGVGCVCVSGSPLSLLLHPPALPCPALLSTACRRTEGSSDTAHTVDIGTSWAEVGR